MNSPPVKPAPLLPTELWIEILGWTIRPRFALDNYCSPPHIHEFASAISTPLYKNPYRFQKTDRVRLQLVSKRWKEMVESTRMEEVWTTKYFTHNTPVYNAQKMAAELEISQRADIICLDPILMASHHLHLANIRMLCLWIEGLVTMDIHIPKLVRFPLQLRVLHLKVKWMGTGVLLEMIEKSFPMLEALSLVLRSWDAPSPFSLYHLKVLVLTTESETFNGIESWHFPALDSASLTSIIYRTDISHNSITTFLYDHGHDLRSLQLHGISSLDFNWEKLPKLECIAGLSKDGPRLPPLPQSHPLKRMIYRRPFKYSNPGKWCSQINGKIPATIEVLVFPIQSIVLTRWKKYWETWMDREILELEAFCNRNGITVLDEHGWRILSLSKLFQVDTGAMPTFGGLRKRVTQKLRQFFSTI